MAIKYLYPLTRPTLDLNFAGSCTVDPRITFTRASTATYFDEFGVMRTAPANAPRIDFDPVTGECKGLLIEEQRTNLLTYSEQFNTAAWTKTRATTSLNAATSPDGTLTADKIVQDTTASSNHIIRATLATYTNGTTYTLSFYLKPSDGINSTYIQLRSTAFTSAYGVFFDLVAGTVINNQAPDWITARVELVGGGWCRVSVTATCTSDYTGSEGFYLYLLNTSGSTVYTGDDTSGIYIWGAQLEVGSFPTSYIKTEASQATRVVDTAVMTGTNFSDWYRRDEGTLYAEWNAPNVEANTRLVFSVNDGTASNWILLAKSIGLTSSSEVYVGGVQQVSIASAAGNSQFKSAFAYTMNNFASSSNGLLEGTYGLGTIPVVSQANIGDRAIGARSLNGHIARLAYYPKRLANEQLQALTA